MNPTENLSDLAADLGRLNANLHRLQAPTLARLQTAITAAQCDLALQAVGGLLNQSGRKSRWQVAGEIERRLNRWEGVRFRGPRDMLETALAKCIAHPGCRRARRRIFDRL